MSIAYLKVKIKSLAAEQAIIRHEERRYLKQGRWHIKRQDFGASPSAYSTYHGLHSHRMNLRLEIRAAGLAYGYLRGTKYRQIECNPGCIREPFHRNHPNWIRVRDIVWKYGSPPPKLDDAAKKELADKLKAWREVPAQAKAA